MNKLIILIIVFSIPFIIDAKTGVSVDINVTAPVPVPPFFHPLLPPPPPVFVPVEPPLQPDGYVVATDNDGDMDRDDLIIYDRNHVGFWFLLPSGDYVFRCRAMRYDRGAGEWYYGPWYERHNIDYHRYHMIHSHPEHFRDYMHRRYPRYYENHLRHNRDSNQQKRHEDRHLDHNKNNHEDRHLDHNRNNHEDHHLDHNKNNHDPEQARDHHDHH